jgi:hypothetical protein
MFILVRGRSLAVVDLTINAAKFEGDWTSDQDPLEFLGNFIT